MKVIKSKNLIKMWTDHVPVEEQAMQQVMNMAQMPFIHKHIAIMPDVHYGIGAAVGSVIPTKSAIIPAAVGVDIGCGMIAYRTSLAANDLPENLSGLREIIEARIPVGFNQYTEDNRPFSHIFNRYTEYLPSWKLHRLFETYPQIKQKKINYLLQLGTLGGGNHFIEICLDKLENVWFMIHSGSRGIGNRLGTFFIEKAKKEMEKYYIGEYLPDQDLSYLVEHTELFDDYIDAMNFAQHYAMKNREIMMETLIEAVKSYLARDFLSDLRAINCHHNYTQKERHFGSNVWITRKGAVDASEGTFGIIPGSMGERSFIVRGLGNKESFNSCSHGAGRIMSRTEAKKIISLDQHVIDTKGVECRKDKDILDESPKAYKNIDDVMRSQEDLVEIVYELKQILCVKG